ncbi:MAG: phage portal protein [Candidatus Pacebacteria bacterium]|nr:phage portal protein [Candidatus Paceibacterota bacterium]
MAWYHKIFGRKKEKSIELTGGGFELLRKMLPFDMGTTGLMEQYSKSLYVFACISKIAEKVGSIDINLSQVMNSKGEIKQIPSHPALDLLYRPNKIQTKSEFMMTTIVNKKTAGDAFIWKVRNDRGRPVELWNLRPDMMTIMLDPGKVVAGYKFTKGDGTEVPFAPEDIIHIKDYPNPLNQYQGMSALMPARVRVQTEEFATKYQRDFFLNSARPDAVLKTEKFMTPKQKSELKKFWNKQHRGISNSSKIGILTGGMEYQLISLNQKDMEYIEGIKLTRDDILVAFKMTKAVLGITEDVNRANAETAMYVFLSEVVVPEIKAIIEKLNEEMTYIDFGDNIFYTFVDPTPANREIQLSEYENGIKNNWLLINEIRQRENLPPIKGGWSFYMPLMNVATGGLTASEAEKMVKIIQKDSDKNEKIINSAEKPKTFDFKGRFMFKQKMKIYESIAKEMIRDSKKKRKPKGIGTPIIKEKEIREIYAKVMNKKIDTKSMELKESMDRFANEQMERVIKALEKKNKLIKRKIKAEDVFNQNKEYAMTIDFIVPFIEEYLREAGLESLAVIEPQAEFIVDTKRVRKFIKKRSVEFAESVGSTTLKKLDSTLAEGIVAGEGTAKLAERVKEVYDEFPSYRSELIARTEATAANNEGVLESFRQSSVVNAKEWIAVMDERTRPEHADMDGEIVRNDENFSNGLPYPGEPNCRCVLGGAFIED